MKPECPVCGKAFWVDWPQLWVFKRDGLFLCSYSCTRQYDRKETKNMARPRKDGTPGRKPEKVKKAQEEPKVELVYDPSIAEEYRREQEAKKAEELHMAPPLNPVVGISISGPEGEQLKTEPVYMRDEKEPTREKEGHQTLRPEDIRKALAEHAADAERIRPMQPANVIRGMEAPGITVTGIRTDLGEFYFDKKYGTVDWRSETGEEISLTPADWAALANEIPRMLRILGVDD